MAKTVLYNEAVNRLVVPIESGFQVFGSWRDRSRVLFSSKDKNESRNSIGRATGRLIVEKGTNWVEMTLTKSVNGISTGYFPSKMSNGQRGALLVDPANNDGYTPINGETLLKNLVKSDQEISKLLLKAQAMILQLPEGNATKEKAIPIINSLQSKLETRQTKIKESGLVKFTTVLSDSIDWLKDKIGLGAVITGSALAIGAVSALVGAAALYYVFKPDYDDSKKDLKVSYNLKKLLDSAEPEVAKQIEQDLEKQIDDAYNQGKTDQWFSGIGSMLKYAAIIGGTIYIVPKAISAIQEHNRAA